MGILVHIPYYGLMQDLYHQEDEGPSPHILVFQPRSRRLKPSPELEALTSGLGFRGLGV